MKGMLTGPVTMLQWSFVRDDMPRATVCRQIALAIRDEVADLEAAGIGVIQVDEPAFREGLPLRHADWAALPRLGGRLLPSGAGGRRDDTQIHTHMCYSEFNDIMPPIARDGCGRDLDRDRALEDGIAGRLRQLPLSERNRSRRLRHPRPATSRTAEMAELILKATQEARP